MSEKKLGRGLDFLIKRSAPEGPSEESQRREQIPLTAITPNPFQPRRVFDESALRDLMESIRLHGVIQPIALRPKPGGQGFELISGERRWRACQALGLATIPAHILSASNEQLLEWALIENIQREDLDPMEKARAYKQLIDEFGLTQEAAAERLAQKRSTVANFIRLLDLPEAIQVMVSSGEVSPGHARTLLSLEDATHQMRLAEQVRDGKVTVRQLEDLVKTPFPASPDSSTSRATEKRTRKTLEPHLEDVESRLRESLKTRVVIKGSARRGKIVVDYYDTETLNRVLALVEGSSRSSNSGRNAESLADEEGVSFGF